MQSVTIKAYKYKVYLRRGTMNRKTKRLVTYSLLIAMTAIMTMVIQIPTIGTKGYLNLGDMVVLLTALILGKKAGFIVGGLGSALADLLLGYSHYVPITLVVKGLEGYIAGYLKEKNFPDIFSTIIGGIFMALGYLTVGLFTYGKAAYTTFLGNIMQGGLGAISAVLMYKAIKHKKPIQEFKESK